MKKIKKVSQAIAVVGKVLNSKSTSTQDTYSCDYINKLHTYSTEEKVVGTWNNGKPLYEKTIVTTTPKVITDGTTANKKVSLNISNLEYVRIKEATMNDGTATFDIPCFTMAQNRAIRVDGDITNKGITIYTNNELWSEIEIVIVVNYTKTTD